MYDATTVLTNHRLATLRRAGLTFFRHESWQRPISTIDIKRPGKAPPPPSFYHPFPLNISPWQPPQLHDCHSSPLLPSVLAESLTLLAYRLRNGKHACSQDGYAPLGPSPPQQLVRDPLPLFEDHDSMWMSYCVLEEVYTLTRMGVQCRRGNTHETMSGLSWKRTARPVRPLTLLFLLLFHISPSYLFSARFQSFTPSLHFLHLQHSPAKLFPNPLGTIGITTYAAKNLGDVVYVELPSHGLQATQGDAIGAVESVKSASDILTPISGTIVGVNEALEESPGLINKDPEGEGGWIARIEVSERGRGEFETKDPPPKQGKGEEEGEQYQGLMSEVEYGQFTAE